MRKVLRSFLGLASYYRNFINNIAKIASTLTKKTSEKVEFEWNEDMTQAFEEMKDALCTSQVLVYPNYEKSLIVSTDASSERSESYYLNWITTDMNTQFYTRADI